MQLVEAAILFFVGLIAGVFMTIIDVYTVGSAALLSRVSLWILVNVLFGANMRHRRTAVLGAIPLNLGLIEMYYLTTSYTYAGLARSLMLPLALLSVVGALVALLAWTAKAERNLYGALISAFLMVGTLVAAVLTHDGPNAFDFVCVLLMAYVLFVMRPRRLALARGEREPASDVAPVADEGSDTRREARRRRRPRPTDRGERARRQASPAKAESHESRPSRGQGGSTSRDGRGSSPQGRRSSQTQARGKGSARKANRTRGDARGASSRPSASARTTSGETKSPTTRGTQTASRRSSEQKATTSNRSSSTSRRPTRRTGGPLNTTRVVHTTNGGRGQYKGGPSGARSQSDRRR